MDCSKPGFPVLQYLPEFAQTHGIESVMPSNHLILCHLLLLSLIFPSIRVFSNQLALRIRWPKFLSFSFSISPFSEYSGLISFRMDWLASSECFLLVLVLFLNNFILSLLQKCKMEIFIHFSLVQKGEEFF